MTGKLPGPFDIEFIQLNDFYGNGFSLPKMTAVTLSISALAILKCCVDLNLVRIHLQEGHGFLQLVKCAFVFLPFFITASASRLSSISILLTYASVWILLPALSLLFIINLIYSKKRYIQSLPIFYILGWVADSCEVNLYQLKFIIA